MTVRTLTATARAGYSVVTASDLEEACGTAYAEIPGSHSIGYAAV
jgi:hypothetical protein